MARNTPAVLETMVRNAKDDFWDNFFTFDPAKWDTVQTGAGMAISVAGALNGARYLNIATGVTINSETILQSREVFMLPMKLAFGLSMSQRIANQEVFVELVGVDRKGVVETDVTFPSINLNNATNAAAVKFDGAVAANAIAITRGQAISELASGTAVIGTTVATGGGPNFIPATVFEINVDTEEVVFGGRAIDSLAAITIAQKRAMCLPDPGQNYKIRVRVRNLAVAPASTTDVRLHMVRVLDNTRLTVDMSRHFGRATDIGDSLPVVVTSQAAVVLGAGAAAIGSLAAGTAAIGTVIANAGAVTGGIPTTHRLLSAAASTNATSVKGTAGRVFSIDLFNAAAAIRYLKLYNKATAPTVGTDTPIMTILIPATSRLPQINWADVGLMFSLGIAYALTTGATDADVGALTAADVQCMNIAYA